MITSSASTHHRMSWFRRVAALIAWMAIQVRVFSPRPVRWFLQRPQRLLIVAWMVGLLVAGHAHGALADDEIITGPDLAHGGPKTLFESFGFLDYALTVKPDDNANGPLEIMLIVWQVVGLLCQILLWLCLGLLDGALTLLEWLLNLTIYADGARQVDIAVNTIAFNVFWPLISATVAIGAVTAYARWRGEGRGFASDFLWVVAAAALGMVFASQPSAFMSTVDETRQAMASGIIAGSSQFVTDTGNPVGFPDPKIDGNSQEAGTRRLVDGMWNSFGATTYCYAQFKSLDVCKVAGSHALANDDTWKRWMEVLDDQGEVPEFGVYGNYIRGQDMSRLGMLLALAVLILPLTAMLIRLVIAGITAAVGVLLMMIVFLFFLVGWPIPGPARAAGTRALVFTFGQQLQSLFITGSISGVMVGSTVIISLTGKQGFFIVTVLNLGLLGAASQLRVWLDGLIGSKSSQSMGAASYLVMRSVVRTVAKTAAAVVSGGTSTVGAAAGAIGKAGMRTVSGGLRASAASPRMRRMSGVDSGPVRATATRTRPSSAVDRTGPGGGHPQRYFDPLKPIEGPSRRGIAGPPRAPSPRPRPTPSGTTFDGQRRFTAPGRVWVAPPGGQDTARQPHSGASRSRDWAVPPGSRHLSPPDKTAPPPARIRGGVPRITDARPARRMPRRSRPGRPADPDSDT